MTGMSCGASRFIMLLMALVVLLGAFGCTPSPQRKAAGTYELDHESARQDLQARIESEADAARKELLRFSLSRLEELSMTVTLHADLTAAATYRLDEEVVSGRGTWTINGDAVSITITRDGDDAPDTVRGRVDGDTIVIQPDEGAALPFRIVLRKQ